MNTPDQPSSNRISAKNHRSPDGKWETMSRPPGLLRYVSSGTFFGRKKYKGKLLFGSLETKDYDEACRRLPSYIKTWQTEHDISLDSNTEKVRPTQWKEAGDAYHVKLERRAETGQIKFASALDRQGYIRKIEFFWPTIADRSVRDIRAEEFLDFFSEAAQGVKRFRHREVDRRHYGRKKGEYGGGPAGAGGYNRLLGVAQDIVEIAQKEDLRKGLGSFADPLEDLKWMQQKKVDLTMPSDEEWAKILDAIERPPDMSQYDQKVHTEQRLFAEFTAMNGPRTCELLGFAGHSKDTPHPGFRWRDMRNGSNIIHCAKKRKDMWRPRVVPWIDGAKELIERIKQELYAGDDDALVFGNVSGKGMQRSLKRAIKACGLEEKLRKFTLHKMRHLFATKAVEADVTWKVLAEWLGHDDGGILAAKLYSHLREEFSTNQAARVSFRKNLTGNQDTPKEHP